MRTVLVVSYTFPPQYDVSAKRVAKLCKYLPQSGWTPIVLTKDWRHDVAPEDRRRFAVTMHDDALAELHDVRVELAPYRARNNALRRLHRRLGGAYQNGDNAPGGDGGHTAPAPINAAGTVARRVLSAASPLFGDFPDEFRGWVDPAVEAGVRLATTNRVDAILSVCPPATAHLVASRIAGITGIPWVAQFDDLFSFHLERQRRVMWRWHAARSHRAWLRRATLVGAITPAMLEYLSRTFGVDGGVVMVGFDPEESSAFTPPRRDRMRLAYTGSVYLDDHRPELLFEALDRALGQLPERERTIEVVFAGTRQDEALRGRVARFPHAARACVFVPRLSPAETLRLQREADALILFNYTIATGHGTLSFPAKSFEYLNARRPILALPSDPGRWGDTLLSTTRAGVTADTADEAASIIDAWLRTWREGGCVPYHGDPREIERYSQPRQAAALADLLDRAVAVRTPPTR
jgi:hypothetical protein